jgi:catechol 2,3-dioxygenase-like lactoylglutathione lyase family enzyme
MVSPRPPIRLNMAWWEGLLVVAAYIVPTLVGGKAIALLTAITAGIGFGVWRCVQLIARLLEIRHAEFLAETNNREKAAGEMTGPAGDDQAGGHATILNKARIEARIPTQDLARARRWYAEKLGLEPVEERDGGLRYEGAPGVLCMFASAGRSDGSFTQMVSTSTTSRQRSWPRVLLINQFLRQESSAASVMCEDGWPPERLHPAAGERLRDESPQPRVRLAIRVQDVRRVGDQSRSCSRHVQSDRRRTAEAPVHRTAFASC